MGSYIALLEQHRLATEDRVRLSDLKGELFVSGDSLQHPGGDRRVEAFCKKYGRFRPKFHGPVQSLADGFELVANENAVLMLPGLRQPPFSARRRHSTPGGRGGYLEDSSHVAARQSRWCSEGLLSRLSAWHATWHG